MTKPMLHGHRVAVCGATGFLGSHLVERLVREGAEVLAVARSEKRRHNLASVAGEYSLAICDITRERCIRDAFASFRPETVFHLAAKPDGKEDAEHMEAAIEVNTMGTFRVLEASRAAGVKHFIFASSTKVYGNHESPTRAGTPADPNSSYAIGKFAGWQMCKLFAALGEMRVAAVAPSFVYGPRQNWNLLSYLHECVRKGSRVKLMGGTQTRDPLYIDDVVEAFLAAWRSKNSTGQCIPVGGGKEFTVRELSRVVLDALGSDTPVEAGAEPMRPTEIWRNFADNTDAKLLLDWSPRISLREGLRRTFDLLSQPEFAPQPVAAAAAPLRPSGD